MPANIFRGDADEGLLLIKSIFDAYVDAHPQSKVDLYRSNPMSIRVRVVDPAFKGVSVADRNDRIWDELTKLPEEDLQDVSMLVLLTPDELAKSPGNIEFEDPALSRW